MTLVILATLRILIWLIDVASKVANAHVWKGIIYIQRCSQYFSDTSVDWYSSAHESGQTFETMVQMAAFTYVAYQFGTENPNFKFFVESL